MLTFIFVVGFGIVAAVIMAFAYWGLLTLLRPLLDRLRPATAHAQVFVIDEAPSGAGWAAAAALMLTLAIAQPPGIRISEAVPRPYPRNYVFQINES